MLSTAHIGWRSRLGEKAVRWEGGQRLADLYGYSKDIYYMVYCMYILDR